MKRKSKTSKIDRRSGSDRRKSTRYSVRIDVEWVDWAGRKTGTVSDISDGGCFVLCSGEVEDGERIILLFPLSDTVRVQFACEVVNHTFEIGFGARFIDLSPAQKDYLSKLIDLAK